MSLPLFTRIIAGDLLILALLATAALCVGLVANQLSDRPISLIYQSKENRLENTVLKIRTIPSLTAANYLSGTFITLTDFRSLVETKVGIVIDVRPEIFYRAGHIPGALNLPRDDFEDSYTKLKHLLMHQDQLMVVYCSGPACEDSELVGDALRKLGFTNVLVFKGGWEKWTQTGLRQER